MEKARYKERCAMLVSSNVDIEVCEVLSIRSKRIDRVLEYSTDIFTKMKRSYSVYSLRCQRSRMDNSKS